MKNASIITNHDKVIANYAKVLQIATAITNFDKIITNYSVLQNNDKTDVSITNLASSLILSALSISVPEVSLNGRRKNRGRVYYLPITNHCVLSKE